MQQQQAKSNDELSAEELEQENGAELPGREAMSLLGGDIFNPSMPAGGSDLLSGAGGGETAPAGGTDLSSIPIPLKNPLVG